MFYDIDRSTHLKNIERLEGADKPDSDANTDDLASRSVNRAQMR